MREVFVVKIGSYHKWCKSKIVYKASSYEDAKDWLFKHLEVGQHGYIDVRKERLK